MNKIVSVLIALMLVSYSALVASEEMSHSGMLDEEDNEIIAVDGFEGGFDAVIARGWIREAWTSGSDFSVVSSAGARGEECLQILTYTPNDSRLERSFDVDSSTTYLVSVSIKTKHLRTPDVGASLSLPDEGYHSKSISGDLDWVRVSLLFKTAPTQKTVKIGLRSGFHYNLVLGIAHFDDFLLERIVDPKYQTLLGESAEIVQCKITDRIIEKLANEKYFKVINSLGLFAVIALVIIYIRRRFLSKNISAVSCDSLLKRKKGVFQTWGISIIYVIVYSACLTAVVARHEMWRDELQVWLIARDSNSLTALFHALSYEGHPPLWHIIVWIASKFVSVPESMLIINIVIASVSAFFIVKYGQNLGAFRYFVPLGYFCFYEWGVIARNYSIGVMLLVMMCSIIRFKKSNMLAVGLLGALAVNASFHTAVVSIVVFLAYVVRLLVQRTEQENKMGFHWQEMFGLGVFSIGVCIAVYLMIPPNDSGYAANWFLDLDMVSFRETQVSLINAFYPMPVFESSYWNSSLLMESGLMETLGQLTNGNAVSVVFWFTLFLVSILAAQRGVICLLSWLLLVFVLLLFFYVKYLGFMRHHGHLYLGAVCLFFVFPVLPSKIASALIKRTISSFCFLVFGCVLFFQLCSNLTACKAEILYVFSSAQYAGAWLKQFSCTPDKYVYACYPSAEGSAVLGFAGIKEALYVVPNRKGSYVIWDSNELRAVNAETIQSRLKEFIKRENKDCILISGLEWDEECLDKEVRLLRTFDHEDAKDNVWIYLITNKE